MATEKQDKEHGRKFDQLTHDGTGSAASVGPGGTGDLGNAAGGSPGSHQSGGGNQQAGRTDDLLSGGADGSFAQRARQSGELETGMGGTGSTSEGSRQSGGPGGSRQGSRERESVEELPPGSVRIGGKNDRGA